MRSENNTLFFLYLVFVSFNANAQIRIEGFVKDSSDMPLPFVTVTASTTQSVKVVSYNFSDAKGYFSLTILDSIEVCFLSASLLGYRKETKEIATTLFISPATVSTDRKNLLAKTKARNTAEMIVMAITKGWV